MRWDLATPVMADPFGKFCLNVILWGLVFIGFSRIAWWLLRAYFWIMDWWDRTK